MKLILGILFFIIIFRLGFSIATRFLMNRIRRAAKAENEQTDNQPSQPVKKKKIDKDKGDYVDFEEIE